MEAKARLAKFAALIDVEVQNLLDAEYKRSKEISPIIAEVNQNLRSVCFGGKRLRGAFVYHSYIMHGGTNTAEALKAAACVEILHSYLLAHDDFMDKAELRHNDPTLNSLYAQKAKVDGVHFGNAIAVNTGDVLCHIALEAFGKLDFPAENKIQALAKLHRQFADTGYGQILDCFGPVLDEIDEDYVIKVLEYKTGKYTYETPLHIGALLAGASEKDLDALTKYAIPGGIAFQIQDDILGMFGESEAIGKPAESDLKEGKRTTLTTYALDKAKPNDRETLSASLGNTELTREDLEKARKIIIDTGSLEYSKELALKFVNTAKEQLAAHRNPDWNQEGEVFLIGVADYMINREL